MQKSLIIFVVLALIGFTLAFNHEKKAVKRHNLGPNQRNKIRKPFLLNKENKIRKPFLLNQQNKYTNFVDKIDLNLGSNQQNKIRKPFFLMMETYQSFEN